MKKLLTIVLLLVAMTSYSQDGVILDIKGMCSLESGQTSFSDWEEFSGKIMCNDEKITFFLKTKIIIYVITVDQVSEIKWGIEALDPDIGTVYVDMSYDEEKDTWFVTMMYDMFSIMYACDFVNR